ncbi:protein kinase domain-containing protein [Ophiocordyceps sinensis CO18]|uniref:non-specific serine/threonine protein kinase n=1 Tax=Ophiocordyceps sinensis (strain Co18 / CGMCC 3.14243) TaxID=911162 RepID=T5AE58_OPHSC|nr:protein kinase domain-containing protein [Ophiocordyceps sinensis CO18]
MHRLTPRSLFTKRLWKHDQRLWINSPMRPNLTLLYSTAVLRGPGASDHPLRFNYIEDVECLEKYRPGGYNPVCIGDVLHKRYRIVDKIGFGSNSTSWLARDAHLERYVAVKVGTADPVPPEIKTLKALSLPLASSCSDQPGRPLIPTPLDEFELHGPNGNCPCYTTTPA